jgi:hypothetical protein
VICNLDIAQWNGCVFDRASGHAWVICQIVFYSRGGGAGAVLSGADFSIRPIPVIFTITVKTGFVSA